MHHRRYASYSLTTLDALGIVSLDLAAQPLDLTTPQGTRLTGYGDVTFTGGTVRQIVRFGRAANDLLATFGEAA
jgi:hypothetical protein